MATSDKKTTGTSFSASIPPRIQGEAWLNFGNVWIATNGKGALFLRLSRAQLSDALKHLDNEGNYEVTVPLRPKKPKPASTPQAAAQPA